MEVDLLEGEIEQDGNSMTHLLSVQVEDSRWNTFEELLDSRGIKFSISGGLHKVHYPVLHHHQATEGLRKMCKEADIYFSFTSEFIGD